MEELVELGQTLLSTYANPRYSQDRLVRAYAVVKGKSNPERCWEDLATEGLIPHDWVANPQRLYGIPRTHFRKQRVLSLAEQVISVTVRHPDHHPFWHHRTPHRGTYQCLLYPASPRACAQLAATLPERKTAESQAIELLTRLRADGINTYDPIRGISKKPQIFSGPKVTVWLHPEKRVDRYVAPAISAAISHTYRKHVNFDRINWLNLQRQEDQVRNALKDVATPRLSGGLRSMVISALVTASHAHRTAVQTPKSSETDQPIHVVRAAPLLEPIFDLWELGYTLHDVGDETMLLQ